VSRHVATRHEPEEGLPYAVAKARRECQHCGAPGARVVALRFRRPRPGGWSWWLGIRCGDCIARYRADRTLRVVSVA
jgi:hypothetical protein